MRQFCIKYMQSLISMRQLFGTGSTFFSSVMHCHPTMNEQTKHMQVHNLREYFATRNLFLKLVFMDHISFTHLYKSIKQQQ